MALSALKSGPAWDCGLPGLSSDNEYTATAFSKSLRIFVSALYQPRREIQPVGQLVGAAEIAAVLKRAVQDTNEVMIGFLPPEKRVKIW